MNVIGMKAQKSGPGERRVVDLIITWDKPALKKKDDPAKKQGEAVESGCDQRTTQESSLEEAAPQKNEESNRVVRPANPFKLP